MAIELFGFQIQRKDEENKNVKSFVEPTQDDGAVNVSAAGGAISSFLDLEGAAKSEAELVQKYRTMMQQPEVVAAVDDIVNEAVNITFNEKPVECVTDDLPLSDGIKKKSEKSLIQFCKCLIFQT